jgi:hypothetical protein
MVERNVDISAFAADRKRECHLLTIYRLFWKEGPSLEIEVRIGQFPREQADALNGRPADAISSGGR